MRSIFARLLLYTLPAALLPLLALGAITLRVNEVALSDLSRELRLSIAADARGAVRAELSRADDELTDIGHLLLGEGTTDDARRIELAGARVTSSSLFDAVTLYDNTGRRAGTLKAREAQTPVTPDTLAQSPLKFVAGETHPGGLLDVFVPIEIGGVRRGTLFAQVKLGALFEQLAEIGEQRLQSRGAVVIVDAQRKVIAAAEQARSGTAEALLESLGAVSFTHAFGASPEFLSQGEEWLGAVETVPDLGWAILVMQPRALAYGSLRFVRRSVFAALLLAALCAVIAGALAGRWLTRPVRRLALATRELAEQKFGGVGASVTERKDELGELGRSFDRMAGDLDTARTKLITETEARTSLSRYLSREVVEMILRNPERLRLGGERREVTILFSDVVAFTRLSETLAPETAVAILNELFTFATEIVHRRGGIIDKFIGDSVMAVFGTPERHDDDAERAVLAAEDLRRWLDTANRKWRLQHDVELQLAMGVNTGIAIAGNVGSEKRLEYTVVGDAVNVAARLEGMARPGQILVSAATAARLNGAFQLTPLGETSLHGRTAKVMIYEVPE